MEPEEPGRLALEVRLAVTAGAILLIVMDGFDLFYERVLVFVLQLVIVVAAMVLASVRRGPLHELMVLLVGWASVVTILAYA